MNDKVERVLEYSKITEMLSSHAGSDPGRKLCRELQPYTDLSTIELAQTETADALAHIFRKGSISFGGNRDFNDAFHAIAVGASLSAPELLHLASFLENVARARAYGKSAKDATGVPRTLSGEGKDDNVDADGVREDSLYDLFDCLYPLTRLSTEIRRCILSEEEIADDASSELKKIRRTIAATNDRIHTQLSRMVNVSMTSYLQDAVITMRDGRYCIPVKSEHKSQVAGIVHDQSSSGSTLFIEPASVVSANNELRELEIAETKEIERILADLSAQAGEHLTELRDDAANMTKLDFVFAKASLALEMDATRPVMNDRHEIDLKKARHPLIDRKKVVPIDFTLGKDFNMVIITGPNTGGKTVTLKTAGLLSLMAMAGLHIPAGDRSELSLFREIFADIGDEQSIEQNLSTFSAHMTTIVDILRRADKNCLCLFDELGAGTDPTEGAALAISILNFMHTRGIRTMATTHYSELKVYAMRTEGIQNASCEFDVETLRPTYHLILGIAGKSNAFAISSKLGLPNYIIETAREQMTQETKDFEQLLSELEEARTRVRKEEEQAESLRLSLEKREEELKKRENALNERKDEILRKANEEARDILSDAKQEADEAISELRRAAKGGSTGADTAAMERARTKIRTRMNDAGSRLAVRPSSQSQKGKLRSEDLIIGDRVKIMSMGLTGTVSTLPDKQGKLFVQCGIMRTQALLSDLQLVAEDASGNAVSGPAAAHKAKSSLKNTPSRTGSIDFSRSQNISSEINLLGMTSDEAIRALDKYLDDARLAHLSSVRVVHGKGTGALRTAVNNYLRRQKWVSSYRAGDYGEGDAGVTIVYL